MSGTRTGTQNARDAGMPRTERAGAASGAQAATVPRVRVTRRAEFSAAHHLRIPGDPEGSRAVFGPGADPPGHGHNYEVHVSVESDVDPVTGFGLNVAELKTILAETVISRLDGRDLAREVPELAAIPPTCEALAVLLWRWLAPCVAPASLIAVRVAEHPRLWAEYCGE